MNTIDELVYVGKIVQLDPIENADFIVSATVVCGKGGKWRGIVKKADFDVGSLCIVYLPDSLIGECEAMRFMATTGWRVKMRRFRGAPSEVLIMPMQVLPDSMSIAIGLDLTEWAGVTKYMKKVPANLSGDALGPFPGFIPRTDEPNYQRSADLINQLRGNRYYVSEKADGSSTTAYRYRNAFGLCSRNLELKFNENNGYWKIALKYDLQNKLPEGYALQWETCGPGIQSNPMGFKELAGLAFSGYNILEHRYLDFDELTKLCNDLGFPMCPILSTGDVFDDECLDVWGEGKYANGKEREGVVVRSMDNLCGHCPISFKVINLNYEK